MDVLQVELAKLRRDANLGQTIQDVDKIIEQLERARETIVAGMKPTEACHGILTALEPNSASITLAKLQNPLKHGFEKVNDDLKKVHTGQNKYGKALKDVGQTSLCINLY